MLYPSFSRHSSKLFALLLLLGLINFAHASPGKEFGSLSSLSVTPSSLSFTSIQSRPSATQNFIVTVANVSATTKTFIKIPPLYEVPGQTDSVGAAIILTGNITVAVTIRFSGSPTPGNFDTSIIVETEDAGLIKKVALHTTNLPTPLVTTNPNKLTGFTAVQGGAISPAQSFDLSIAGMLTQGNPFVTVTAPKGYAISFTGTPGTFVNSFVLFSNNTGKISSKVFVIISNINPVGTISGNVSITGDEINTKNVAVSGTVTAKPQPTLAVDKTSLSGFTTTTFKASAAKSYLLTATNLDAGVSATVKAPTGYEVSLTNTTSSVFSSQLTIAQNIGSINVTVFVRLTSQSTAGAITGTVVNSVAGLTKNVSVSGTVNLPPSVSTNPISLTGFSTVQNEASTSKTYTLTATSLAAGDTAIVTAPANYEIREQNIGSFTSRLVLKQNSTGAINRIIEVRIKAGSTTGTVSGSVQNTVAGIIKTVSVSGTINAASLSTTTSSLTFTAVKNQVSDVKSYKVVATNLAQGLTVAVTASGSYEIGLTSNGPFTTSLNLPQNVSKGVSTDVFVRLKATATTGTITGTIQHAVAGLSRTVSLSASVAAPVLTLNPTSLSGFSTIQNQPSATKSYTFLASNLATGITATITAPAGYEISVQGTTTFATSLTLSQTSTGVISKTILVRLKAQAANASVSGNINNAVAGISKTVAVSGSVSTATFTQVLTFNKAIPFAEQKKNNSLSVTTFPNPFTDKLTIAFKTAMRQVVHIRILSLTGEVLTTHQLTSAGGAEQVSLPVAGLSRGMYILEVIAGKEHQTLKVVKQ